MSSHLQSALPRMQLFVCDTLSPSPLSTFGHVQLHESEKAMGILRSQHAEAEKAVDMLRSQHAEDEQANGRLSRQVSELCAGRWVPCRISILVLRLVLSDEGLKRHVGYRRQGAMHGDVQLDELLDTAEELRSQLAEAERANTRLTEQVVEICVC